MTRNPFFDYSILLPDPPALLTAGRKGFVSVRFLRCLRPRAVRAEGAQLMQP